MSVENQQRRDEILVLKVTIIFVTTLQRESSLLPLFTSFIMFTLNAVCVWEHSVQENSCTTIHTINVTANKMRYVICFAL